MLVLTSDCLPQNHHRENIAVENIDVKYEAELNHSKLWLNLNAIFIFFIDFLIYFRDRSMSCGVWGGEERER